MVRTKDFGLLILNNLKFRALIKFMLKIRLARTGKKNASSFRIVLQESTRKPTGKYIELLGFYNPRLKQKGFKEERIKYWLEKGAIATPTVHNLLVKEGIVKGAKIKVHKQPKQLKKKEEKEPPSQKEGEEVKVQQTKELSKETEEGEKQTETKKESKETELPKNSEKEGTKKKVQEKEEKKT